MFSRALLCISVLLAVFDIISCQLNTFGNIHNEENLIPHEVILPKAFGNYTVDDLKTASSCGSYMSSYNGITAYSNGANQGTGDSCAGWGSTGLKYQCVEYVQRYYNAIHGTQAVWPVEYAAQMCWSYPGGVYPVSYPQPGDVIVFSWGTYGHTALVTSVYGDSVNVIEQNSSPSGTNTYAISGASCFLRA